MTEQENVEYSVCKCHRCNGRLLVSEYSATVNMRIDGKLHPVGVRRVPCHRCEDCGTATMGADSDEYFQYYYQRYLNANNLNTWRHRAWRYMKRQWNLFETMFYRGPLWQWRREGRKFPLCRR